ncbi:lipid-A-disaccharide synthase-related protein [Alkalinema pantanalense CENA528]|uniref:lipid-A-disaccharide synthase-related protein n=1 Tax=Alkalinema pantanalense TaxID=1620705 RepID=UPI003D6DF380
MRLLCLSNGHGEDGIALRILEALQNLPRPSSPNPTTQTPPTIEVLPIVGEGHAYTQAGFPLIGKVQQMPSGGFIYMDGKQLARDIQGGLLKLTLEQIRSVQRWAKEKRGEPALVLAVGDIVPMLFAWMSGLPFAFVGTAKSEYYLRDETGWLPRKSWWDDRFAIATGSVYYPWERWLMARSNCVAVFPRDRLTAETLQRFGIRAYDLGNPMMDFGEAKQSPEPMPENDRDTLKILLLPGSRAPEAYANWELLLSAANDVMAKLGRSITFLAAIAPSLDRQILGQTLQQARWQAIEDETFTVGWGETQSTLKLSVGNFAEYAQRADCAIALAGTATEQFVGLGKPVITLPGAGPQFTPAFAEAQTRLLGGSVQCVAHPQQVGEALNALLNNPDGLRTIAENGRRRMGEPGAAQRIARKLVEVLGGS